MSIIPLEVHDYAFAHSTPQSANLRQVEAWTRDHREDHGMLTGRLEGGLLRLLVSLSGARRIVEVGTFTGYSALSMAQALPEDGTLVTCELDAENAQAARRHFAADPHGHKITLLEGPGLDSLATLRGPFDLAFVDADKENYPNYLDALLPMMRPGGLLAFDNALWSGAVALDDDLRETTVAIRLLNERLRAHPRLDNVLLTVRDGLHLARVL
ncbi:MAG: methyltransferase [Deltaproteobacteria bacterium]|nr:methyltransferase [Deltaproteobacteria bacterium]HCH65095.1 methyltransferase [Deltaproteobacteria bacterium]